MPKTIHEIDVELVKDSDGSHAIPKNIPKVMQVGDIVHYRPLNTNGEVTIEFRDLDISSPPSGFHSPFMDPGGSGQEKVVISSNDDPITVANPGIFVCRCFIKEPGEKERVGWSDQSPKSGGNHEVRRNPALPG